MIKNWNELTNMQKAIAREQYISIRENEEGRNRFEINNDYNELIDASFVECCQFEITNDGEVWVII